MLPQNLTEGEKRPMECRPVTRSCPASGSTAYAFRGRKKSSQA